MHTSLPTHPPTTSTPVGVIMIAAMLTLVLVVLVTMLTLVLGCCPRRFMTATAPSEKRRGMRMLVVATSTTTTTTAAAPLLVPPALCRLHGATSTTPAGRVPIALIAVIAVVVVAVAVLLAALSALGGWRLLGCSPIVRHGRVQELRSCHTALCKVTAKSLLHGKVKRVHGMQLVGGGGGGEEGCGLARAGEGRRRTHDAVQDGVNLTVDWWGGGGGKGGE